MTARQFGQFLRRNGIWMALVGVVCGAAAYVWVSGHPSYQATAKVILQNDDRGTSGLSSGYRPPADLQTLVAAQVPVVLGPDVLRGAAHKLGSTPADLREHLSVTADPASAVIRVQATDDTAGGAQAAANAVTVAYVAYRGKYLTSQYRGAAAVVQRRLSQLLRDLAANRERSDRNTQSARAERNAIRAQYSLAFGQRQTLLVQAAATTSDAQIIAAAPMPGAPTRSAARFAIVGLILGLLFGLVLTLMREQFDDRFRGLDDLSPETRKDVFGEIPSIGRRHRNDPRRTAEVVDSLRAAWVHVRLTVPHEVRRIVVTSAGIAEGKTFTARHLAEAIADVSGSVILVSGDLRHASLDQELGIPAGMPGLTTLLAAEALPDNPRPAVADLLVDSPITGVRVLPVGPPVVRPSTLLNTKLMRRVMDRISDEADVVVIDTAPVLPVPDTLGLVDIADQVFVLITLGTTSERDFLAAKAAVTPGASAVGVLVNRVKSIGGYYSGHYEEMTPAAPSVAEPPRIADRMT
jgi:Mrp family chromosome partitioning ATPase/capsular polysaccharide biosynthesis protein